MIQSAKAFDIMVLQSSKLLPYEKAVQGFEAVIGRMAPLIDEPKCISAVAIKKIVLSQDLSIDKLDGLINKLHPDLVLAVGSGALDGIKENQQIPILYLMTFPHELRNRSNIIGIEMRIDAATQLSALKKAVPQVKRVGLIYHPIRSKSLQEEAKAAALSEGITLVSRKALTSDAGQQAILDMAPSIDAFWMIPDPIVTAERTLEVIAVLSQDHGLPVLTFADKYLKKGATISVFFDAYSMGMQAGEMAKKIITGVPVKSLKAQTASAVVSRIP